LKLAGPAVLSVVCEVLALAGTVDVRAAGMSMWPTIRDGSLVTLAPLPPSLRSGQIVLLNWNGYPVLHRIVATAADVVYTVGDGCVEPDPPTPRSHVLALATAVRDTRGVTTLTGSLRLGGSSWVRYAFARARLAGARVWRRLKHGSRQ
jgi:hypothetical protein